LKIFLLLRSWDGFAKCIFKVSCMKWFHRFPGKAPHWWKTSWMSFWISCFFLCCCSLSLCCHYWIQHSIVSSGDPYHRNLEENLCYQTTNYLNFLQDFRQFPTEWSNFLILFSCSSCSSQFTVPQY
jgi:hypothetical protein